MPDNIDSVFKGAQDFGPNSATMENEGDFIGGPSNPPAETPSPTTDPKEFVAEQDKAEEPKAEEKKPSKLDKLKLNKPKDEEPKVEGKPEAVKSEKPSKEENFRILRQAKEELEKLKPEYEKFKQDFDAKDKELLTTKEELAKLKALGLNEQERQEYQKYRDLHAIEAVKNSEDFKNKIEAPIKAKVDWITTIAERASLDGDTKAALYSAVDIPDKLDRQKKIREIFKNADLDIDDYQTYTGEVINAANELNENLYPKMDETLAKAQEIELAARDKEKNQHEQLSAKEREEFSKEHGELVNQLTKDHLRMLFEDTDLNIDGTTLADAVKNTEPATDPKEKAWQAIAGASLPFVVQWAQKILDENHQLKQANNIRNKVAPSLGKDGIAKSVNAGRETLSADEVFKNKF